ncbi:MAG TPA: phosphatidate cytidylyltransferase, partial [Phycisphaerales bacterium]|nr:phosphatidate cytidylyltransferase [Phycisphaerales bacterium]
MLRQRLILGPVMILVLVGTLWLDEWLDGRRAPDWWPALLSRPEITPPTFPPGLPMFLLGLAVAPIACWELKLLLRAAGIGAARGVLTFATMLGMTACYAMPPRSADAPTGAAIIGTAAALALAVSLIVHSKTRTTRGATAAAGAAMIALVYFGLLYGMLLLLRRDHSAWVVLGVLVITKSSDIGAYFTGRAIGRHKLIPWLSPGKTWEGLVGGVALSAGLAVLAVALEHRTGVDEGRLQLTLAQAALVGGWGSWLLSSWTPEVSFPWWSGSIAGVLFGLTGQLGDLIASL